MKLFSYIVLFLFLLLPWRLSSWDPGSTLGALASGKGHCGLAYQNIWSLYNNPAQSGYLDKTTLGFTAQNRFGISDLNAMAVGFAVPTKTGTYGLTSSYMGNEAFGQYFHGLSVGRHFNEKFAFGFTLFYSGISVRDYGNFANPGFNLGFGYQFSDDFSGTARINNPTRSRIHEISDERMQASVAIGFQQKVSKKTDLVFEAEAFEWYPLDFRCGIEYQAKDKLGFVTGFSLLRQSVSIGMKTFAGIPLNLAFVFHNRLGMSSVFDTGVEFGKNAAN
jgi:hypothetical protein